MAARKDTQTLGETRLNGPAIISELIRNMELGQFELNYSVLLPCLFSLYLHPDDYARLAGVLELIVDDAKRTLCARVTQLNAKPTLLGLRRPGATPKEYKIAGRDWVIEFFADTDPNGNTSPYSSSSLCASLLQLCSRHFVGRRSR